jgi:hypothetical protein
MLAKDSSTSILAKPVVRLSVCEDLSVFCLHAAKNINSNRKLKFLILIIPLVIESVES